MTVLTSSEALLILTAGGDDDDDYDDHNDDDHDGNNDDYDDGGFPGPSIPLTPSVALMQSRFQQFHLLSCYIVYEYSVC